MDHLVQLPCVPRSLQQLSNLILTKFRVRQRDIIYKNIIPGLQSLVPLGYILLRGSPVFFFLISTHESIVGFALQKLQSCLLALITITLINYAMVNVSSKIKKYNLKVKTFKSKLVTVFSFLFPIVNFYLNTR